MLWILAYFAGALTILSPCILPVLPFVFARSDQPFRGSGLPLLAGMALTFAAVASIAAVGGAWAVQANQFGRIAALVLLTLFAFTLLSARFAEWITHPLVRLGGRLSEQAAEGGAGAKGGLWRAFLLGIATGMLWAPCAGPILGLILTGAALEGAGARSATLLLAYAAGAATSLGLALAAGGRLLRGMKRYLGADVWVRRVLGMLVLLGIAVIALGRDRDVLTALSARGTAGVEQKLLGLFGRDAPQAAEKAALEDQGPMPALDGATAWLNSPPLTAAQLRGKVVLVDFWTYSCINCLRSLPYVKAWADKYGRDGLVVIGVHAPEFAFEKDQANVERAVRELGITYPVALDNDYAIWKAYNNHYWPAHYFIDAKGRVRHVHFGEGEYDASEKVIRTLLMERGTLMTADTATVRAGGVQAEADWDHSNSPETYIGYGKAANFASPEAAGDNAVRRYSVPSTLRLNEWGLSGDWRAGAESAVLQSVGKAPGRIVFRFHARDLHLVLGPLPDGPPIRFRVSIDGAPPGADHGVDTDADGYGEVKEQRLYQLIRQQGTVRDRTFTIEFLSPGLQAYSFTFG